MPTFVEMDPRISLRDQLQHAAGPVVLINTFSVAPTEADALVKAWAVDAAFMKAQPGFISAQLHRGVAGSSAFLNYAVWESMSDFKRAFEQPEFQTRMRAYPPSVVASPHIFEKLAVPGICVG